MSKLELMISKWKFKKIAIIYIAIAVLVAIGCVTAVGIVFKDRISFAWQYSHMKEAAEKVNTDLQSEIKKLASSSSDIIDILILDRNNNITYSAKNSEFAVNQLNLTKAGEDKNYLVDSRINDAIFKYVKGEEFLFASIFNHDFGDVKEEYNDESFYENNFSNKTVYMLSYLETEGNGSKIYIITIPTSVSGGMLTLKITAAIAMLFFMIYWVLLALWIYQKASRAKLNPLFWGIIVLLTNIAGVIVYLLYNYNNAACLECGASQSKSHLFCTNCGVKIGEACENCGGHISKKDIYCSNCGKKNK